MGKTKVKKEEEIYDNRVYKIVMNFFKGSKPKIKIKQVGIPVNPPPYHPKP